MKKSKVIGMGILSLAVVAVASGYILSAQAQGSNRSSDRAGRGWDVNQVDDSNRYNNLTTEQRAVLDTIRTDQEKEMEARQTEMSNAINSGNYETWAAVVTKHMGDNAPILTQVTAANFAQFVEGYKLMIQAQEKFEAIGIDMPGTGMGKGMMMGRGLGRMHGSIAPSASTSISQ